MGARPPEVSSDDSALGSAGCGSGFGRGIKSSGPGYSAPPALNSREFNLDKLSCLDL